MIQLDHDEIEFGEHCGVLIAFAQNAWARPLHGGLSPERLNDQDQEESSCDGTTHPQDSTVGLRHYSWLRVPLWVEFDAMFS